MADEAARTKRRYGQSCEVCRRQKKRCEGRDESGNSLCKYCAKHGLECRFPASGEKSKLEAAIEGQRALEEFVSQLANVPADQRDAQLEAFARDRESVLPPAPPPPKRRKVSASPNNAVASGSGTTPGSEPSSAYPSPYVHHQRNPLEQNVTPLPGSAGLLALADMASEPSMSVARGSTLPRWLDYCIQTLDKAGLACGFDASQIDLLLESFFSYHNPRFRYVDKALFYRSVHSEDHRFCSPFLIACISAFTLKYAVSWQHRMEEMGARAHMLMAQELSEPAKLSTIQGLLILSNYHANMRRQGLVSQYIKMASVLLQSYAELNQSMAPEEQALHTQLRWTVYAMSVYMNMTFKGSERETITQPDVQMGAAEDKEVWKPIWLPGEAHGSSPVSAQPSYEHATFVHSCIFYSIVDDILAQLYKRGPEAELPPQATLDDLRDRLVKAEANVPPHLIMDCSSCPWPCPPVHVLFFNMLIRVGWLLLYQPRMGDRAAEEIQSRLRQQAADVQTIFSIGYAHYPSRLSFLFVYGVFSGAAIDLDRLKAYRHDQAAYQNERQTIGKRLAHTIEALQICKRYILGIDASVALLQRHCDAALGVEVNTSARQLPPPALSFANGANVARMSMTGTPTSAVSSAASDSLSWLMDWTNGHLNMQPMSASSGAPILTPSPLETLVHPGSTPRSLAEPSLGGLEMNDTLTQFLRTLDAGSSTVAGF